MKDRKKLKHFPKLKSDKEAEDFVTDVDLTEYDFSGFEPIKFEFANKSARINMRLPESFLDRIKAVAMRKNIYSSYQLYPSDPGSRSGERKATTLKARSFELKNKSIKWISAIL